VLHFKLEGGPRRLVRVTPVETRKMKVFISLAEAFDW